MTSSLHGVGEIVAYLPYQLGFVPRDSLAIIGMRDRRVVLTARVDRPDSSEAAAVARHLAASVGRSEPDDVLVLCYGGFGTVEHLFLAELRSQLRDTGAVLSHVGHVRRSGSQWRAERCSCGGCPRDWTQVPPASGVGPVAERVLRGVVPVADRADLGQRYDLRHPLVASAVGARLEDRSVICGDTSTVLPRVLLEQQTPVHRLPVEVLAAATLAVDLVQVRDDLLSWLMPEFLPAEMISASAPVDPHHLGLPPLWLREIEPVDDPVELVARRIEDWVGCIPAGWSVPVLLLAAGLRWTAGDGVLASMALDRALALEPDCNLAQMFAQALNAGLRPSGPQRRPA